MCRRRSSLPRTSTSMSTKGSTNAGSSARSSAILRNPGRAQERLAYVLSRLQEDGITTEPLGRRALPTLPPMIAFERPRRDIGFHFVDQVAREAKALAGIDAITANSYTVRSTIHPQLQRAVEEALQEGLWRYERYSGRLEFRAAEAK